MSHDEFKVNRPLASVPGAWLRHFRRRGSIVPFVIFHSAFVIGCFAGSAFSEVKPPPPRITAIYPTAHTLPANHLKFYLHFSQPMRQGVFLDHCSLLDDHNQPVIEPFRETELWNEDGTRLTLWFHPGRQKTGVNLNEDLGPVVLPHHRYKLVISGKCLSADGVPIGNDVEKTFETAERATDQLDIASWRIIAPAAGTRQPLEVRFPAPLDHALIQRCLRVMDAGGKAVEGTVQTGSAEKTWQFKPKDSWYPGSLTLEVDSFLEDLAGNSLARPFEVDLTGAAPRKVPSVLKLEFKIEAR